MAADTSIEAPNRKAATDLLTVAAASWEKAEEKARKRRLKLQIRHALAFLPVYNEYQDGSFDFRALKERLFGLNDDILGRANNGANDVAGLATEVAVSYLLARRAAKCIEGDDRLAWPAASWQDDHWYDRNGSEDEGNPNFDIRFGHFPETERSIQVKSQLTTSQVRGTLKTRDGDEILDHWKQTYSDGIALIFGDVHMGNTKKDPFSINRKIADSDRYGTAINLATQNIIDEIDS